MAEAVPKTLPSDFRGFCHQAGVSCALWEVRLAVFVLGELFHFWGSVLSPSVSYSEIKDQDHSSFP